MTVQRTSYKSWGAQNDFVAISDKKSKPTATQSSGGIPQGRFATEEEVEDFLLDHYGEARPEFGLYKLSDSSSSSSSTSDDGTHSVSLTQLVLEASLASGIIDSASNAPEKPRSKSRLPFKNAFSKIKSAVGGGGSKSKAASSSEYDDAKSEPGSATSSGSSAYDTAGSTK